MRREVSEDESGDEGNESEGEEDGLRRDSTDELGGGESSGVCTDFELDESIHMGSASSRGCSLRRSMLVSRPIMSHPGNPAPQETWPWTTIHLQTMIGKIYHSLLTVLN